MLRRKPIKRKKKVITEEEKEEIERMWSFFLSIWRKRPHNSEVTGERLLFRPCSANFHHILHKETYPEYAYDEDNIIIMTMDEHSNVHLDAERYEEVNKRREKLKKKYNIS